MMPASLLVLFITTILQEATSVPPPVYLHYEKRSPSEHKSNSQIENVLPTLHNVVLTPISSRKQKSPSSLSISLPHHIIVPNLHVIPLSNVRHSNLNHLVKDNINIPNFSHTVSHSSTNITHPTHLIPILVPIHNHLVPVHDLTVIPLHNVVHKDQKIGYKTSNSNDDSEAISKYRNPLGGYGAGWFYGGHGAGHGFHYVYG